MMDFIVFLLSISFLFMLVRKDLDIDMRELGQEVGESIRSFWLGLAEDSNTENESMEVPQIEDDETLDEFERRLERVIEEGEKDTSEKLTRRDCQGEKKFEAETSVGGYELYSKDIGPGHRVIRKRKIDPGRSDVDEDLEALWEVEEYYD